MGKAQKQSLWWEMRSAYNRARTGQRIFRVQHNTKGSFDVDKESCRRVQEVAVPLSELAAYFTAWEVEGPMIPQVEALLMRAFANDTLNLKMEKLYHQKGS